MDGRMTRAEHLEWAKKRALEYCDRGKLQRALDSLISDLSKHPETHDQSWADATLVKWMEGELATQEKMREFIDGIK